MFRSPPERRGRLVSMGHRSGAHGCAEGPADAAQGATGDPTLSPAITDTRANSSAPARRGRQQSPMPVALRQPGLGPLMQGSAPMTAPVDSHLPQPAAT